MAIAFIDYDAVPHMGCYQLLELIWRQCIDICFGELMLQSELKRQQWRPYHEAPTAGRSFVEGQCGHLWIVSQDLNGKQECYGKTDALG